MRRVKRSVKVEITEETEEKVESISVEAVGDRSFRELAQLAGRKLIGEKDVERDR